MGLQAGEKIDQYEVIEHLGAGAYAETYKAQDTSTGSLVLLKVPDPLLFADPALYQRFMREAEIARRLDHPGVQKSLDLGHSRSQPYFVLEFIEGINLRKRLREFPSHQVPIGLAKDWGRQLARALGYLHDHGITHRDLKPENILVSEDQKLKIIDFGAALLLGARRLTWRHLNEGMGTPDYMSPEQIQGHRGDPRSDIYAWGTIMYEFLTGGVPFPGDNWLAAMAGHLQRTPRRPREIRPEVPETLECVVLKAMRRYPENRYQSAAEVLADLDRVDEKPGPQGVVEVLRPRSFDLSPEPPLGGMAAAESAKRLWFYIAMIALGFIGTVALIITLTVVLR